MNYEAAHDKVLLQRHFKRMRTGSQATWIGPKSCPSTSSVNVCGAIKRISTRLQQMHFPRFSHFHFMPIECAANQQSTRVARGEESWGRNLESATIVRCKFVNRHSKCQRDKRCKFLSASQSQDKSLARRPKWIFCCLFIWQKYRQKTHKIWY